MFSNQISMKPLERACRNLSTMLSSGVSVTKCFKLAAEQAGDARCQVALMHVRESIRGGSDISSAMDELSGRFPPLLVDMVRMAEHSGMLPEVLKHMADHYENNIRLKRRFLGAIAWPVMQLLAAILIIGMLLFVLGFVGQGFPQAEDGSNPLDLFGVGTGGSGAITWLVLCFGTLGLVVGGFLLARRTLAGARIMDPFLLKLPVIGGCLRSFAVARFSWGFYLTQQTGMPIQRSLAASLKATGNGAYVEATDRMVQDIEAGDDLSTALAATGLFPSEYIQMVSVAETSGTVPEQLHRLSPQFEEQARRAMIVLTTALGVLIWLVVSGLIIFAIFRIFMLYINMINQGLQDALQ